MSESILIVGATGKLGGTVLGGLVDRGETVRALVRNPKQEAALSSRGVDVVLGDITDHPSLAPASAGIHTVVTTANAFLGRGRNSSKRVDLYGNLALIDAARRAGVERFVFVSADIARPDNGTDFFRYKYQVEDHLSRSGMDYVIVRATAFMDEWTEIVAGAVRTKGVATVFGDGQNPINFVARDDVAAFILRILADSAVQRERIAVGGPENLTLLEVVAKYEQHTGVSAKRKHVPVVALRTLRRLLAFDGPTARKMSAALEIATTPQTHDNSAVRRRFPELYFRTLDEWLSLR